MIDSHAHIYLPEFKEDLQDVIDASLESGVEKILMPNIDHTSIEDMLGVEDSFPDMWFSMMGLHPCSVKKDFEKSLYEVEEWLNKKDFLAVGEIGTDLYWDKTFWNEQQEAFKIQCDLALKFKKPVVIHCRESISETIALVKPFAEQGLKGVFHCFTGSVKQAHQITDLGFFLGIGGVSTFKNGGMDQVLPDVDMTRLLLETDSPYLAPVPFRGKRNSPAYLSLIRDRIAEIKNIDIELVESNTDQNTTRLFFPR